ncbi:MAG: hypothetical protein LAN83_03970 [Acidobacteriia bacterium]|nr:hypothetical protein [Terriglobia bacterium]
MATALEIEVRLDESGMVHGLQGIGAGLDAAGQKGSAVFARMSRDQERAHDTELLMAQTLGITMPRSLEKLLSKLPGVSDALSAAFKVGVVVALGAAVVEAVNHLEDLKTTAVHALEAVFEFEENVVGWVTGSTVDFSQARKIAEEQSFLKPLEDQLLQFQKTAATAGKEGYGALKAQAQIQLQDLTRLQQQQLDAAGKKFDYGTQEYADAAKLILATVGEVRLAQERATNAQIVALRRKNLDEIRQLENQRASIGLEGSAAALEKEREAINQIDVLEKRGVLTQADAEKQRVLQHDIANREIYKLEEDFSRQVEQQANEATLAAATGIDQIAERTSQQILKLRVDFQRQFGNLDATDPMRRAAQHSLDEAVDALRNLQTVETNRALQSAADQTTQIEEQAAAASVPPWLRASAQIVNDYQDRMREIDRLLADHQITEADAQFRREAIWSETNSRILDENRQMRDELAGELESVFDDITSGNIGQRILSEIKKFFFQIVAEWLLSMNSIRSASAGIGGGGLLGSLLGSLFGIGGGSSSAGGAVSGGTIPGLTGNAAPAAGANGGGLFGALAGLSIPGAGGLAAVAPAAAATLSAGVGTAGVAAQQKAQGFVAQTLLGSLLQKAIAKIFTHGITIGGKFFSGGILGMLGLELGITGIGLGYQYASPVLGGITGAAGGALAGTAILPGIGTVIGAIIGGIAGIFGGVFGRRAREKQAWDLVLGKYYPAMHQTLLAYENYQEDAATAYQQLDDLEKQAWAEMNQIGHSGRLIYWQTIPARATKIHKQIEGIDKDRTSRGAQIFGAPEFQTGGLFTLGGSARKGLAILEDGEYVINPQATRQNRAQLEAINHGRPSGEFHIHIHAIDALSFRAWMRKGGAKEIKAGLRLDDLAYTGEGVV